MKRLSLLIIACVSLVITAQAQRTGNDGFDVSYHPNPSAGIVYFDLSHLNTSVGTSLSVYDLTGRMVFTENLKPQDTQMTAEVDLTNLGNGVYFAIVQSGDQRETRRLSISK